MQEEEGAKLSTQTAEYPLTVSCTPLCPQALLLLGLNPVSTTLQDQRCESLSLASNVSGESSLSLTSQVARFPWDLLPWNSEQWPVWKKISGTGVSEGKEACG